MAFVDEQKEIFREKVNQSRWRLTGAAAVEVARIILDTLDETGLAEHFKVIFRALRKALRLEKLVVLLEIFETILKLGFNTGDGAFELILRSSVVSVREDMDAVGLLAGLGGQGIDDADAFEGIEAKLEAIAPFPAGREKIDGVAHDAEVATLEGEVVSVVLHGDEIDDEVLLREGFGALGRDVDERLVGHFVRGDVGEDMGEGIRAGDPPNAVLLQEREGHFGIMVGRADAVDTGNRSDDDSVRASEKGDGRSVAKAVDFVVDGGVFLNISVGRGDVGFWLVVVEVGDEVVNFVFREELAELGIKLGGESFVMGKNKGRALIVLDNVRHGEGLAGAGDAEQGLLADVSIQARSELLDGLGLITSRLVFRDEFKFWHISILYTVLAGFWQIWAP